jgi:hypothetical protein
MSHVTVARACLFPLPRPPYLKMAEAIATRAVLTVAPLVAVAIVDPLVAVEQRLHSLLLVPDLR